MNEISIRVSTAEDARPLKQWLLEPGILRWFPMLLTWEVDDSIRMWLAYREKKAAFTLEVDGKPAGMFVLYLHAHQKTKHQTLFAVIVSKEFRGKGLGTKLIEYGIQQARDVFQIEKLHLEVYEGNPGISLYKRMGFKKYGYHPKFLKESKDHYIAKILMEKSLKD